MLICGLILMVGGLASAAVAWRMGYGLADLKAWWTSLNGYLVRHPSALFWAIVILPGLPVPMSALLFTAGVVWRDRPVMACALCLLAMSLNFTWTYWLAAGPARQRRPHRPVLWAAPRHRQLAAAAVRARPDDRRRLRPELGAGGVGARTTPGCGAGLPPDRARRTARRERAG